MNNNTMNKESCGFGKKCKRGYKPSPVNRELYKKLKINAIRNSNKWPSRYSSYELINEYKKKGGKYFCKKCGGNSFGNGGCNCNCNCNKSSFGAPFGSFYPQGAQQNTFLTPSIKNCLNVIYGPADSNYNSSGYRPDILNSIGQNPSGFGKSPEIKYLKSLI